MIIPIPIIIKLIRMMVIQIMVIPLEGDAYTKLGLAVVVLILEGLHAVCYRYLHDHHHISHY